MRSRVVPGLRLELTEISLGGASLGNLYESISEAQAHVVIAQAWSSGIRYFDTAPHCGLGLSERRLGEALKSYPRDEYVLSTKVGRLHMPSVSPQPLDDHLFAVPAHLSRRWDFSREGIRQSVEERLQRTGMDRYDILYLHDPDISGIADAATTGAAALLELRDEGMVTAMGIGSNSSAAVTELFLRADIDIATLAGRYSFLEQHGADEVFEAVAGRAVVAVGVFNSGILASPRSAPGATHHYQPASDDVLQQAPCLARSPRYTGHRFSRPRSRFPCAILR